jgi:hypothetical protein
MKIDLRVATPEECRELKDYKFSKSLHYGDFFAPISLEKKPDALISWKTDNLGPHGAFEDTVSIDMYKTVIQGGFRFLLDYPMEHAAVVEVETRDEGFSMADIVSIIKMAYSGIYQIEDGDTPPPSFIKSGDKIFLNRPATNGAFGIWGHGIHDLIIEELRVIEYASGEVGIHIGMGS